MRKFKDRITFWSAVSLGIGGMVGGGIFAVLGLAIELGKGATPIAFLIGGLIALITSYSYAKLCVKYPSQGGTVEYLNKAYGNGIFTGAMNVLLWLSYVVMLSLYSYAFGSYAASVFAPNSWFWKHFFITLIIVAMMILNALSAEIVGKGEEILVGLKVGILLVVVVFAGMWTVNWSRFATSNWPSLINIIAGGMIIFLAYEGFELIANTAKEIENIEDLPKAFYISVLFVIFLYVSIAIVTVGNLNYATIVKARDYALAMAVKPIFGRAGFLLIVAAALLSTGSAINATLYGAARISYIIAKYGELPKFLEKKVWNKPLEGLILTGLITIFFANFFDLTSISTMGSAGFLLIFALVNLANYKLREKTNANPILAILGFVSCIAALIILVIRVSKISIEKPLILAFLLGISFLIEVIYRGITGREIKL